MPHLDDVGTGKTLGSWKEIAARLGVTVRTVQRWEKMAGLPIHRRGAGNIGRIFAHSVELDRWLAEGGPERAHRHDESHAESHAENGLHAIETKPDSGAHRRWWIGGMAGLSVALCAAGFWAMQALARTPSSWDFEGSKLVVKDARGRVCWEKQFPAFNAHFGAEVGRIRCVLYWDCTTIRRRKFLGCAS
jgi:transcriptional regulator with XRE-family HTH domain